MGQAQAGGGSTRAGPSSGETGGGQKGETTEMSLGAWWTCWRLCLWSTAAKLRELTATVFKTYLAPCLERVAEATAEAGRLYHESAGAIKEQARSRARRRSRAARSPVRACVGGVLAQFGGDEGAGTRTRGGVESRTGRAPW